jgi:hypothetical protein
VNWPAEQHYCRLNFPAHPGYWGQAVTHCEEEPNGTLWVQNGEFGSQVNFCPNCGFEARTKAIPEDA